MSKYIVLYQYKYEVEKPAGHDKYFMWPASTIMKSELAVAKFDDPNEAAKFAQKYDGYVLVPAQITVSIDK